MRTLANWIDSCNEWVGKCISWSTLLLVILVSIDVFRRYFFQTTNAWIMELEWHLFAAIFLIGAGFTFKRDKHVRVDLFYDRFNKKEKALTNMVGILVFLIPMCLLLIIVSFNYALDSYLIGEGSPDPGGLPHRYIIKSTIVIGSLLLLLQAISEVIKSWQDYRDKV